MKPSSAAVRWITGGAITAGAAGVVLAFAGVDTPVRVPLVVLFLTAAPAVAVASLLPGLDPFSRLMVAVAAALVINVVVAEAMLAADFWSLQAGLAIVALISVMLAVVRLLPRSMRAQHGRS